MAATLSIELVYLALSVALLLVHIAVQGALLTRQAGLRYNASPRDEGRPIHGIAGRAGRALRNFNETFPAFAALVLAVQATGAQDAWTGLAAALYFWARLAYLPTYLAGIPVLRSLIWCAATAGIVILLWRLVA